MGKRILYLPEHHAFIREYYPSHGAKETAEKFFEKFGIPRTERQILWYAEDRKIKVTEERRRKVKLENTKGKGKTNNIGNTCPVGTIRVTRKTKGEPYIKTEKGWVMLKKFMIDCPEGMRIVHLNGDTSDCSPENLMAIDADTHARMTVNHFWSSDPELTRTGIECCRLESSLSKDGFDVKKPTAKKPKKGLPCKTNTGEYHITRHGDKYRVHLRRGNLYVNRTAFKSLEAAIYFRDMFLQQKGEPILDRRYG